MSIGFGFIDFMLTGKTLTDFTIFLHQITLKNNDDIILKHFMANVYHETHNTYTNLNDQQQLRFNKVDEAEDYFVAEIKERELMSKRRSKSIASFDYFVKSLIVLSVQLVGFLLHLLKLLFEHQQEQ